MHALNSGKIRYYYIISASIVAYALFSVSRYAMLGVHGQGINRDFIFQ